MSLASMNSKTRNKTSETEELFEKHGNRNLLLLVAAGEAKQYIIIILFLPLFFHNTLFSQTEPDTAQSPIFPKNYGVFFNYKFNYHRNDLRQLPDIPDSVPFFADGISQGCAIGVFYEHFFSERLCLLLRGAFSHHPAEIAGEISSFEYIDRIETNATIRETIEADISSLLLEPILKFYVYEGLSLMGGISAGLRINTNFKRREDIVQPPSGNFDNGSRSRIVKNKSEMRYFRGSLIGGIAYDIPVAFNGEIIVSPEILYSIGYSDILKGVTWDNNSLRFGLSLKYSPSLEKKSKLEIRSDELKYFN